MAPRQLRENQWYIAVVAGMASYIDAAAIISFGIVIVIDQKPLGLSGGEVGAASALLTLGVAVGAVVGGRLGDRFGRRPVFSATMIVILCGIGALILSSGFSLLVLGAALLGLGTGADLPVSLSTISEAADPDSRGRLIGFSNVLWLAGGVVSGVGSAVVGDLGELGAQILLAHIGIVALFVLLARLPIAESQTWLLAKAERAKGSISIRAGRARPSRLLRTPYAVPFLALIAFYTLVNLAANTLGQFSAYLLVNVAGVSVSTAAITALVSVPFFLTGYLWFLRIADGPYRFRYFTMGAGLWIVGLLIPAILGFSLVTFLIGSAVAALGQSFAFETIMKVWSQESFPTLIRTTAQGTIIASARAGAAILAAFTPTLISFGPTVLYLMLAAVTLAGTTIAWLAFRSRDGHSEFDVESEDSPTAAIHTLKPRAAQVRQGRDLLSDR